MGDEMEEGGIPYEEQWIHMHPYTLSLSLFLHPIGRIFWYHPQRGTLPTVVVFLRPNFDHRPGPPNF